MRGSRIVLLNKDHPWGDDDGDGSAHFARYLDADGVTCMGMNRVRVRFDADTVSPILAAASRQQELGLLD